MSAALPDIFADETGVTAIEYGLIAALVAIVIIGVLTTLGTNLSSIFKTIAASMNVNAANPD